MTDVVLAESNELGREQMPSTKSKINIKEEVLDLVKHLKGYSESRMPFTYHHDFIRNVTSRYGTSRGEVASAFRGASEDHLYSIAFRYLFSSQDPIDVVCLPTQIYNRCRTVLAISADCLAKVEL
jgi:hypothetical protein